MPDFTKHEVAIRLLEEAQSADDDQRELARDDHLFVTKVDGQWEPKFWSDCEGKPRYTFDMTSPIVDQISGDIEQSDFDIKISPAGNDATKELAELRDGMVRNIENLSNAQGIYADAGRNVVTSGIDGWMVVSEFLNDNSFDQDIVVKPIYNFTDRVWFDVGAQNRDASDSEYGFLLSAIPTEKFKQLWPEGSGSSVSDGNDATAYFDKAETVVIGHIYYRKQTERELVKTSLGRVFENDEDFKKIEDELAAAGETVQDTRMVKDDTFFMRKFDADGWLEEEEETVFSQIPLVPAYGNFKVIENKTTYHGAVRKLVDPQRVMNYSLSREIEEGALAPRAKYWMTTEQAKGHTDSLRTLNTNADPVQFYNNDATVPGPPQQNGGAQINQGLRVMSDGMQQIMGSASGIFAAGMGNNPNAQSGVAIEKLQTKSNNITVKYFKALEIAICQTGRLILDALPKVYDVERQVRIMSEDGSFDMQDINQVTIDQQTGEQVTLNDLTIGKYDVTCTAGPSFNSRQQETVQGLLELAAIDPSIIALGQDILLNNISTPGIDKIAERSRHQLLSSGVIPEDQLTDDEKEQAARAAQQPQEPSAEMVLAQAEQAKADADHQRNQIEAARLQADTANKQQLNQIEAAKLQLKAQEQDVTFAEKSSNLDLKARDQQFNQLLKMQEATNTALNDVVKRLNTNADTMKTIREASGADVITGPGIIDNFITQSNVVTEGQEQID
ncbi:MAG: hypothetical protein COB09_17080 [Thalassobium sp.]|nr:MAG: hypothetical protein COB09_17080 [Thalassobium sp.]